MLYVFISIAIDLWIIFLNGAEHLENTFTGYMEFDLFAESAAYIRLFAWFSLILSIFILIRMMFF